MVQHRRGGANVWRGTAGGAQVALVQQLQQLLLCGPAYIYHTQHHNANIQRYTTLHSEHLPKNALFLSAAPSLPLLFLTLFLPLLSFVGSVHRSSQVPHLDAAIAVAGEEISPGSRPHPAGTLTLPYHEARDGGPVHRLHLADPNTHTFTDICM